jgi:CheY-like chemotaxis protein
VSIIREGRFDLGLFDVNLPDMNGIAVLKEIRQSGVNLPIIFMTGFRMIQVVNEAFPEVPVYLLSGPNVVDQFSKKMVDKVSSICLAYGGSAEVEILQKLSIDNYGYISIDAYNYKIEKSVIELANGFVYTNTMISDALAHLLYLRESGFNKSTLILGTQTDGSECREPYTSFEFTGCVFKPFDLQQLLAMISQEASDLH